MSLFGSIQVANNALMAAQLGLQVVGENVANANTPGYSRAQLVQVPATTEKVGNVLMGLGVEVTGVRQQIDQFLNQRLRTANGDQASAQTQLTTYQNLEGALNSLGSTNITSSLTKFFGSLQDVVNQPEDVSVRNTAVLNGQALTRTINSLAQQVTQMRSDADSQLKGDVQQANSLVHQIAGLNLQVSNLTGSQGGSSSAVGLVDQRNAALDSLSKLVNVKVNFDQQGNANVFVGNDYLVYQGTERQLDTTNGADRGQVVTNIVLKDTQAPLDMSGGEMYGLVQSRDTILGGFTDQLNGVASTLASEFNKIYTSGQGQTGYSTLTSLNSVSSNSRPLDAAGLSVTPTSGSFQVQVYNTQTQQTTTSVVNVDLSGLNNHDTTLSSLASQLNGISGISASVNGQGQLTINSASPNLQFTFGNDTSGALSALGLNTFFTGSDASTIGVNSTVLNDPTKFAASTAGIGNDVSNAVTMSGFLDQPLDSHPGQTFSQLNAALTTDTAQASANSQAVSDGATSYQSTLAAQQNAVSGVNVDEEAVNMITYQRAYQASAKIISTINEMLNTLMQI
ncbi:MAG: flagellar hook-associated protein FlgK [Planctomycetes bacterium]|nr:flagellar hook-associated protein FlgK [Planctomycetota bacterium]